MTYFVAKMAQQGAAGFAHRGASRLALGIVGLDEVERDQAVVVSCQDLLAGRVSEKVKHQAALRVFAAPGIARPSSSRG